MFTKPTLANNRYELISPLGQGGMACVFKALDTRLKVEKAIKIPNHKCLTNKKIRDRFETEATTMAVLHHKNIVVVHDIRDEMYEDPNGVVSIKLVYMVMEMLPGGSLQDRIDDHGPLHPQQAIDAAIAMSQGLGYAHQNNVVHRDVKLDNVLIGSDNTLKVTDFGIAQIDGGTGMTQTGATMGTLAYMAPEQKLSSRRATSLSDLYSVGASLYVMLTGRNPSELYASDIQEVAFADFPSEVTEVLRRCCNIDVTERYQSAEELIEALQEIRSCFGLIPEDTKPFFIPREDTTLEPDDILRQDKKVTNMWTTLLGIDPDELSVTMPRPNVVRPQHQSNNTALDLDLFSTGGETDTAFDLLGLDLTGGHTGTGSSEQNEPSNQSASAAHPAPGTVLDSNPAAPVVTHPEQKNSSSLVPFLTVGLVAAFAIIGWLTTQSSQEAAPVTPVAKQASSASSEQATQKDTTEKTTADPNKENTTTTVDATAKATTTPKEDSKTDKTVNAKPAKKDVPKETVVKTKPKKKTVATPKKAAPVVVQKITETANVAAPTTFGSLVVTARPWAKVFVGDKKATCAGKSGNTTACKMTLPTGRNRITLINTVDMTKKVLTLNITEGKNSNSCWNFESQSPC